MPTARPARWRTLLLLGALVLAAPLLPTEASAAPPQAQALQARVGAALADYAAGRHARAQAVFEQLADQGVPLAEYNLAVMHLRNEVPRADRTLARQLLLRAARGGFVTAQFMLAQSLENGDLGPRDLAQALQWYEVAATSGSVEAQVAMGTAYFLGRGKPKDMAEAARWYREGAKGGDVGAMYLLASMYEHGDGVPQDLRLARYWYDLAARAGDEAAPGKLKDIDARLRAQRG